MEDSNRQAGFVWAAVLLGCAALLWLVPLFHIRPLQAARQQIASQIFNARAFVDKFWTERLLPSTVKATDAAKLLAEIKIDPRQARAKHGRTFGLSNTYYYYVSGKGQVVSVDKNSVSIRLTDGTAPEIVLETGNIFGNTVRDATGLLDVNEFPNSRDFNDISAEINRRIEESVLPAFRTLATPGATLRFIGCAEITDDDAKIVPLHLIPLRVETQ